MSIDFQAIRRDNPMLEVVSRYVELIRRGSEFVGLCPFHNDSKPSMTVYNASDGLMRFRCFACGAGDDVIDFVSAIEGVDTPTACKLLSNNKLPEIGTFKPPKPKPDQSKKWCSIVPVPIDAPQYDPSFTFNPKSGKMRHYRPSRVDRYTTAQDRLICYVVRLDFDDGQKVCLTITFCVGPNDEKKWCAKRMPAPFPLQGLDELAKRPNDCVLMVSGEKCREFAMHEMKGFIAISWLGGDQTVSSIDISPLMGRNIVFHPDADASSRRSMIAMFNRIEKAGTG